MTKKLKIVAVVVGILFLAGCGNKAVEKNENKNAGETKNQEKEKEKNQNGIVSSIKDAMGLGKEMKCSYKIKSGEDEMEMTTYIKGKKYRGETKIAGNTQKMIFNEDAMYSWSEKEKKGMKMTKACTDELAKNAPKSEDNELPEAMDFSAENAFDNAMDVKCVPNSGTDFSVPSDVEFVDQCEMLKGIMNSIPAGANIPNLP